jgi:hypothetical protein
MDVETGVPGAGLESAQRITSEGLEAPCVPFGLNRLLPVSLWCNRKCLKSPKSGYGCDGWKYEFPREKLAPLARLELATHGLRIPCPSCVKR